MISAVVTSALILAQSPTAVIVEVPIERGGWPAAETAIAREFALLGLSVIRQPAPESNDWEESLSAASTSASAAVAVSIVRKGAARAVTLWVRDAVSDKLVVRRISAPDALGASAPVTLALKIIELLQASLLEVSQRPTGQAVAPEVANLVEKVVEQAPPAASEWSLRLAASWFSGAPPLIVTEVVLSWSPLTPLELELMAGGGLAAGTVMSAAGRAQLGFARVRLAALWRVKSRGLIGVSIGAGSALVVLMGQGANAEDGYNSALDATALGEVFGRLKVDLRGERWIFGAHVELGAWLPKTIVFLGNEPATAWGFPVVSAGLSGGVRW